MTRCIRRFGKPDFRKAWNTGCSAPTRVETSVTCHADSEVPAYSSRAMSRNRSTRLASAAATPNTSVSSVTVLVMMRLCGGLASAGYNRAFSALTASPGARAHYDRRRANVREF